jgi:hypothetical protein
MDGLYSQVYLLGLRQLRGCSVRASELAQKGSEVVRSRYESKLSGLFGSGAPSALNMSAGSLRLKFKDF